MLIINHKIYSRSHKLIMIVLECIIIILSLALVLLGALGQFFIEEKIFYSISSFVWALGILSIADIFRILKNKQSIALSLIVKIQSRKKQFSGNPTAEQQRVLDKLFSSASHTVYFRSIIINGAKTTGKSECVDFILKRLFLKIKDDGNLVNFSFHYIDCYDDAYNATQFITELNAESVKNTIIFIDNCNEARGEIIPNIEHLSKNHNCCIIMMEEEGTFFYDNRIFNADDKEAFNKLCPSEESILCTHRNIIKTTNQKRIVFAIYLFTKYKNLFKSSEISKLLSFTGLEIIQSELFIRKLKNKKILQPFPIFSTFLKLTSEAEINFIAETLIGEETDLFKEILVKFVNYCDNDEIKWMCLFELPWEAKDNNANQSYTSFNKAIAYGNYAKLLKILKQYCDKYHCEDKFAYEFAVLYYYNGDFDKAYTYYKNIAGIDGEEKNILLIETLHGQKDKKNKQLVTGALTELNDKNELLGKYWEYHILSEKGQFNTDDLEILLKKLMQKYKEEPSALLKTTLERSFTDLLRFNWIEGNKVDIESLKVEFETIFKGSNRYDYYIKLYFEAGNTHYSIITHLWLNDDLNQIEAAVCKAIDFYDTALALPYQKIKSKTAAKTKLADVSLMQSACKWEDFEKNVLEFKENAEQQNIDVFIAYAQTLLAKIKILKIMRNPYLAPTKDDIDNIMNLLNSARSGYEEYKNNYGVNRCDYLIFLFQCLLNFDSSNPDFNNYCKMLRALANKCTTLEAKFIHKLFRYSQFKYMNFYNSIKYFPIILQ